MPELVERGLYSGYGMRTYVANVTPVVFPWVSSRMEITAIVPWSWDSTLVRRCVTRPLCLFTISFTNDDIERTDACDCEALPVTGMS